MLTPEETKKYQERLEAEKRRLLGEIKKDSRPESFGSETSDPEDEEADMAEEFVNDLATAQIARERVGEIDKALQRIADGKYGICEKCGGEIPKKVLDLVPESNYCENCKK